MLIQFKEGESPIKGKLYQMELTNQEDFIQDYCNRIFQQVRKSELISEYDKGKWAILAKRKDVSVDR